MTTRARAVRFALRGIALGILVAIPVSADAPPGQYALFSAPDRRIKDLKTGLVWERAVSPAPVAFAAATCPSGLRLPTLKELLTLVDEAPHEKYDAKKLANVKKYIDQNAFGAETPVDAPYWTSSMEAPARPWTVDFATGETHSDRSSSTAYYRCVQFRP